MRRRSVALLAAVALGVPLLLAQPALASGAAPGLPVLAGPASGATGVTSGARLQVTVSDPDDTSLDVHFYGRPKNGTTSTNPASPFTFLVIPDTQNYSSTGANKPEYDSQTTWIASSRAQLNTAFVAHLGDIVGTETTDVQWQTASGYQATLDNAGVPNSVLPGNHDMNLTTGSAVLYNQYFPPSRYANAAWNSASASYGGYLGENQFGTDPVDRQNMDNYALFSAGGMDFLLINLEFDPPDYAIDWARKILAAYPNRRAILATHSYVDYRGDISSQLDRSDGGNSPQQLWQKLVSPSCSIFMVVNGHFHSGDLSEARRTDTNSCGKPVFGLLSDYQDRAMGGNGWLRYYTFSPSTNSIQAYTYSPWLQQYETDADSSFTLPYDMSTSTPAPFTDLGAVTVNSGDTASIPIPSIPASTGYEWYATVSDGTTTSTSSTWSFTTAAPPAPAVLAQDGFGRAVQSGWGTADTGGAWTLSGPPSRYSVTNGVGVQSIPAGATQAASLSSVQSTSTDVTTKLAITTAGGALPNNTVQTFVGGRVGATGDYSAQLKVAANGSVQLFATRSGAALAGGTVSGLTWQAGVQYQVRVQVDGTSPTTIRARVWKAGTTQPSTWNVTATDSTAGMQSAGSVRVSTYASSSITNGPAVLSYDDFLASPVGGGTPPGNVPPAAAFTPAASNLDLAVDGSASTDTDGIISSYAWTFGDGSTATGRTASHSYATGGTYTVTLTVADNDGATNTTTASVTVTAPPPSSTLAADSFTRAVSNGWGTADTGGTWTVAGTASRYSVANGVGVQTIPAGITTTATLGSVSSTSADVTAKLAITTASGALPNTSAQTNVAGRVVGANDYGAQLKVAANGAVTLLATRTGTSLGGGVVAGLTWQAGQQYQVRVQVTGTSPTTVRARVWKVGTTQPSTWNVTSTDSTAALQAAGSVRVSTYVSSSITNGPAVLSYDDVTVSALN